MLTPDQFAQIQQLSKPTRFAAGGPTATEAQKKQFTDLLASGDFGGAARIGRSTGFSDAEISKYVNDAGLKDDSGATMTTDAVLDYLRKTPAAALGSSSNLDADKREFAQKIASGDYAGASTFAQSKGFDNQDIANYTGSLNMTDKSGNPLTADLVTQYLDNARRDGAGAITPPAVVAPPAGTPPAGTPPGTPAGTGTAAGGGQDYMAMLKQIIDMLGNKDGGSGAPTDTAPEPYVLPRLRGRVGVNRAETDPKYAHLRDDGLEHTTPFNPYRDTGGGKGVSYSGNQPWNNPQGAGGPQYGPAVMPRQLQGTAKPDYLVAPRTDPNGATDDIAPVGRSPTGFGGMDENGKPIWAPGTNPDPKFNQTPTTGGGSGGFSGMYADPGKAAHNPTLAQLQAILGQK